MFLYPILLQLNTSVTSANQVRKKHSVPLLRPASSGGALPPYLLVGCVAAVRGRICLKCLYISCLPSRLSINVPRASSETNLYTTMCIYIYIMLHIYIYILWGIKHRRCPQNLHFHSMSRYRALSESTQFVYLFFSSSLDAAHLPQAKCTSIEKHINAIVAYTYS